MLQNLKFYIDGHWVDPVTPNIFDVINPATEEAFAQISMGTKADVDKAVAAAKAAFPSYSRWSIDERIALLERILEVYETRFDDVANVISLEMGAPITLAQGSQAAVGRSHFQSTLKALKEFNFDKNQDGVVLRHEPIGVCGLITPWNWPMN
ncbi:MAG: aldehyde dehydrogenase family protein, partial [Kordiimonadaceae bacterium]|nr:aldehyde dehydrogenase family protein [Kordiimonadaceae bacterium]